MTSRHGVVDIEVIYIINVFIMLMSKKKPVKAQETRIFESFFITIHFENCNISMHLADNTSSILWEHLQEASFLEFSLPCLLCFFLGGFGFHHVFE
jgi:hypothetical protein